jgi:hypothetical protein
MNTQKKLESRRIQLEHSDVILKCHDYTVCFGGVEYCTLHNRSSHNMRMFPQHWRGDRGIMERTCPHGIGHPDPDEYRIRQGLDDGTHGCDGCCLLTRSQMRRIASEEEGDHSSPS